MQHHPETTPPGRPATAAASVLALLAVLVQSPSPAGAADTESAPERPAAILRVSSFPPGAAVTLKGISEGKTPCTFEKLPADRYTLTLTRKGYRTVEVSVDLTRHASHREFVLLHREEGEAGTSETGKVTVWIKDVSAGEFPSIAAAVSASPPGAVLKVPAGIYRESVVLDRPLEILADAPEGQVVLESPQGPCLRMLGTRSRVKGLTIHKPQQAGSRASAVEVRNGTLVLDHCIILSSSGPAVTAAGAGTQVDIRSCQISASASSGLLFRDQVRGEVLDCDVIGCAGAGVEIMDRANPLLQRCVIEDSGQAGVLFGRAGGGHLRECRIGHNHGAAVELRAQAAPLIERCLLYEGESGGVFAHDRARGTIRETEIFGTALAGIEVRGDALPLIDTCNIHDTAQAGVLFQGPCKAQIQSSKIERAGWAGIEVRDGAQPVIQWCQILRGNGPGVLFHGASGGLLKGCSVLEQRLSGVEARDNSKPVIEECIIADNGSAGIYVHGAAELTLTRSQLHRNLSNGMEVREGSRVAMSDAELKENGLLGLVLSDASSAELTRCRLDRNGQGPFLAADGCTLSE